MLLVSTAVCSAVFWSTRLHFDLTAVAMVLANLAIMMAAATKRLAGATRSVLLGLLTAGLIGRLISQSDSSLWWYPVLFFSPALAVVSLSGLALRDLAIWVRRRRPRLSLQAIGMLLAIAAAVTYMIVVPGLSSFLAQFQDRPSSFTIEELTWLETLRIRSAKFAVFAIFTYGGACVASFINVVAASAPRGRSIAIRGSSCPKCEAPIRQLDNLPLFSYLNLGGRCRRCSAKIPFRYFFVECVGAAIFGSLFLYELITGAANIPGFRRYLHTGILWIILYTKWPVVGIYLYHAGLMSCLLMLGLMDLDRLRCPRWLAWLMPAVFALLPVAVPVLQPVALDDQLPLDIRSDLPAWAIRIATCVCGGSLGWTVGRLLRQFARRRCMRRFPGRSFPLGLSLVGISLGWQAVVTIALLSIVAGTAILAIGRLAQKQWRVPATALLLAVVMAHQPAWQWLAELW